MGEDAFDPTAPGEREIGREMVDPSTGLGPVLAHLYRGEVERAVNWRARLDSTTNWAVTVMAAIVAYVFGAQTHHAGILAGMLMGTVFLFIEARRFRMYSIWRSRVRALQENLFANALDPSQGIEHETWRAALSADYRDPDPQLSYRAALANRLRRIYLPLTLAMLAGWGFYLLAFVQNGSLVGRAGVPGLAGRWVLTLVGLYVAALLVLAIPYGGGETGEASGADLGDLED